MKLAGKGTRKRVWQEVVGFIESRVGLGSARQLERDYRVMDTRRQPLYGPSFLAVTVQGVLDKWAKHEDIAKELNLFLPSAYRDDDRTDSRVHVRLFRDGAVIKLPCRECEQWLAAILLGYVGKPQGAAGYLKRQ